MIYYSHKGVPVMISHFPGQSRVIYKDVLEEGKKTLFYRPNNVAIVSIITRSYLNNDETSLDYQLRLNGIEYHNPAKNYIGKWTNAKKVKFIIKALRKVKEEYTLILDGADVCIMSSLAELVQRFESYNKDIIFNATVWGYPKLELDYVPNRKQYGKYCYLNAGCCMGKTEALLSFYKECLALIRKDRGNPSEQYYIRQVFNKHQNTVFFDYDCRIFQVWHHAEFEDIKQFKNVYYS